MSSFNWKAPRIAKVRQLWSKGYYFQAAASLVNGLPNLFWPGGELAYNRMLRDATRKYGHYNAIQNWRMIAWRELFHLAGGLSIFGCVYGSIGLVEMITTNDLPTTAYAIACLPLITWFVIKELIIDVADNDNKMFVKDFLDVLAWSLPLGLIFLF